MSKDYFKVLALKKEIKYKDITIDRLTSELTKAEEHIKELEYMCEKQAAVLAKDDCGCPCCERTNECKSKVKELEALVTKIHNELEYGDVYQWDGGQEFWDDMRKIALKKEDT